MSSVKEMKELIKNLTEDQAKEFLLLEVLPSNEVTKEWTMGFVKEPMGLKFIMKRLELIFSKDNNKKEKGE